MSNIAKFGLLFLLCVFCCFQYAHANSTVFNQEQFDKIKQQNQGKQWLMLLWSVDCPPCFKELAIIQKLATKHDNLAVVIINTDADEEVTTERTQIIDKFKLNELSVFHFANDKADHSRFIIDPSWYGELPRSYFIEKNGKFHGKSGLVKESMVSQWLLP